MRTEVVVRLLAIAVRNPVLTPCSQVPLSTATLKSLTVTQPCLTSQIQASVLPGVRLGRFPGQRSGWGKPSLMRVE